MPTPDRTSLDDIVGAARDILESDGIDGLSMRAVADRVGVRPPSLYKRVRSRDDLIRLVAVSTVAALAARLDAIAAAAAGDAPAARLARLARAVREFAHERPAGFGLIVSPPAAARLPPESVAPASAALFAVVAELAPGDSLEAARTVTAWVTGFLTMELAGSFQLGGDVDRAFEFGVSRIGAALARLAD